MHMANRSFECKMAFCIDDVQVDLNLELGLSYSDGLLCLGG